MKYNLTEKLKFDEDPILQIGDTELTVISDAETLLQVVDVMSSKSELAAIRDVLRLIFSEKDQAKLKKLKLKAEDFKTVVSAAVALAMGEDPDEEAEGE